MSAYALKLSEPELARYRKMAELARASEAGLWERAGVVAGARVADIGCGPGAVLALLADAVGPSGSVVGVDSDEDAVAAARTVLAAAGISNASLRVAEAAETALEPASFDVVMLRHVLAHNGGNEQQIVDHCTALVRPGGTVYLVDVDLTAMRMHPAPAEAAESRDRYIAFHRQRGNDPSIGLRLRDLARDAGLVVEEFRGWFDIYEQPSGMGNPVLAARDAMLQAGVITTADVERWALAMQQLDDAEERPLVFPALFAAIGRRP
jgi:SAM-dependent methyltransferase